MKNLFILLMILGIGPLKSQDFQINSIAFPPDVPVTTILSMVQDQQGNIWLASYNEGIIKFDGEKTKNYLYQKDNPNSLLSNRVEYLFVDRDGFIWIGTFAQGLTKFDPLTETFTHFQHDENNPQSIRSNAIRAITQDKEGRLWIGTLQGIDYLDLKTNTFHHTLSPGHDAQILQKEHLRVLYVDRAGTLWAGSSSPFANEETEGGLFRINPDTREVKRFFHTTDPHSLINNQVSAIFEDSKGNFWVGTAGDGLHTMNRKAGTFTRHTYNPAEPNKLSRSPIKNFYYGADHIKFITEDTKGCIWIGTMGNGINRYDPATHTLQHFGTKEQGVYHLPVDNFWACLRTKDDLLWISTFEAFAQGHILYKVNLSPNQVQHRQLGKTIRAFEEGPAGNIYMCTDNEFIQIDSNGTEKVLFHLNHPEKIEFYHLLKDRDNNLWVSTALGLYHYNVRSGGITAYTRENMGKKGLGTNQIYISAFINPDSLLLGTGEGLYVFELKQQRFTQFKKLNSSIKDQMANRIQEIYVDSRKNIWVGIRNYALVKVNLVKGTFKAYSFAKDVTDHAFDIYEDRLKHLYVGNMVSGLRLYHPTQDNFSELKDPSGILNEGTSIWGITKTSDSLLWLITGAGLLKYNLASNSSFLYGKSWGIDPAVILSEGLFQSKKGDFYMGTAMGYIKCRPGNFVPKSGYNPRPAILYAKGGDKTRRLVGESDKEKIHFNYNENNLTLGLSYVNFLTHSGEKFLQYKLEPYDATWRSGKNGESAFYFKLEPGKYQFRLRALDNFGQWSEDSLSFTIQPPWWKTWWAYGFYALLLIVGFRVVHVYQKRRIIRIESAKAQQKELEQARELEKAYKQLAMAHENLQSTQAQLIQSEKLASLGELTAGIAHEIQNPLNFVNNFSELSADLGKELKDEIKKPEKDWTLIHELTDDLITNQEKISHHGKRAANIVSGMLQHARTGTGTKESTNLNTLAEEYLHLAYHGLKAKNPTFEVNLETSFDSSIGEVNVIPQDIGRVFLNIINNAFYTVAERSRSMVASTNVETRHALSPQHQNQPSPTYQPTVALSSTKENGQIIFRIKDNGTGIPEEVKAKIFQPFFTTKPTGQGTGLGLSLAYDIITKGHGGTMEVESWEGQGTEFTITLPA